jgi:hypothetical protein
MGFFNDQVSATWGSYQLLAGVYTKNELAGQDDFDQPQIIPAIVRKKDLTLYLRSFLFPFGNHITPASHIFSNMPVR